MDTPTLPRFLKEDYEEAAAEMSAWVELAQTEIELSKVPEKYQKKTAKTKRFKARVEKAVQRHLRQMEDITRRAQVFWAIEMERRNTALNYEGGELVTLDLLKDAYEEAGERNAASAASEIGFIVESLVPYCQEREIPIEGLWVEGDTTSKARMARRVIKPIMDDDSLTAVDKDARIAEVVADITASRNDVDPVTGKRKNFDWFEEKYRPTARSRIPSPEGFRYIESTEASTIVIACSTRAQDTLVEELLHGRVHWHIDPETGAVPVAEWLRVNHPSVYEQYLETNSGRARFADTTVEDQKRADERIPILLEVPARIRFASAEPLFGP